MKRILLGICGLLASASASLGESNAAPKAEDLYKGCIAGPSTTGDFFCGTWVAGFYTGLAVAQVAATSKHQAAVTCIPTGAAAVTPLQIRLIIENCMRANPEILSQPVEAVAFIAIERAFPCQPSN